MTSTLKALADAGLDTTGPAAGLYQELAASEDQTTANELLAAGPEMIAYLEQQFMAREATNQARGDMVADASYAEMIRLDTAAVELAQQQVAAAQASVAVFDAQLTQANARLQGVEAAISQQGQQFADALNGVSAAVSQSAAKGWASVGKWK